ncbi:FISUMP domain-containing protein [Reichenbachiella versicolor]|uniref:FISUMP domain-containing protein n=1 Tax=Reichenbachiella versicolor TaxID=1821036 RepID=UPI000D6E4099|nr:FISUMP domain-containing protein [Reichenbachiella versicolor]
MKRFLATIFLLNLIYISQAQDMTSVFYDPRDGEEYETVLMEVKTDDGIESVLEWMSTNLNYETKESFCYNDYPEYCNVFGRLYSWRAAMEACPPGWHLPLTFEWELVMKKYGGKMKTGPAIKEGGESGLALKPAGFGEPNGAYIDIGVDGYYWKRDTHAATNPGTITIHSGVDYITDDHVDESHHNSVRCVKDYK